MIQNEIPKVQTCYQHMLDLHKLCCFQTIEGSRSGPASNSEIKRWFQSKCIEINYEFPAFNDPWPPFVKSIVMFPKNKNKRCTLFYDPDITLIQIKDDV